MSRGDRAQTYYEYVVLICVFVGALIFMSPYIVRSLQGKVRSNASQISEQLYSPKGTIGTTVATTSIQEHATSNSQESAEDKDINESYSYTSMNVQKSSTSNEVTVSFKDDPWG